MDLEISVLTSDVERGKEKETMDVSGGIRLGGGSTLVGTRIDRNNHSPLAPETSDRIRIPRHSFLGPSAGCT
jgi:hypothetical protein